MRSVVTLSLVNQEIVSVFERKVHKKMLFIEQVTLKLGLMVRQSMDGNVQALVSLSNIQEKVLNEIDRVFDEIDKYQGKIDKRSSNLNKNTVKFMQRFTVDMTCSNEISFNLVELLSQYDSLISKLKHFRLIGGFENNEAFYNVKMSFQKSLNRILTDIAIKPSRNLQTTTVDEYIKSPNKDVLPFEEISVLTNALHASFGPGVSPRDRKNKVLNLTKIAQEQLSQSETA